VGALESIWNKREREKNTLFVRCFLRQQIADLGAVTDRKVGESTS